MCTALSLYPLLLRYINKNMSTISSKLKNRPLAGAYRVRVLSCMIVHLKCDELLCLGNRLHPLNFKQISRVGRWLGTRSWAAAAPSIRDAPERLHGAAQALVRKLPFSDLSRTSTIESCDKPRIWA